MMMYFKLKKPSGKLFSLGMNFKLKSSSGRLLNSLLLRQTTVKYNILYHMHKMQTQYENHKLYTLKGK